MSILVELLPAAGPALVVGGGAIAARKVCALIEGGFQVVVVAPDIGEPIASLTDVTCIQRAFAPVDVDARPWSLILACTNDRGVNRAIGELARARHIPVLVADARDESTVAFPATHRDGDLLVGVSTSGADPALAARLRDTVAEALGPDRAREVAAAREARQARRLLGTDA
jgi:siroheme synthase-like protein